MRMIVRDNWWCGMVTGRCSSVRGTCVPLAIVLAAILLALPSSLAKIERVWQLPRPPGDGSDEQRVFVSAQRHGSKRLGPTAGAALCVRQASDSWTSSVHRDVATRIAGTLENKGFTPSTDDCTGLNVLFEFGTLPLGVEDSRVFQIKDRAFRYAPGNYRQDQEESIFVHYF